MSGGIFVIQEGGGLVAMTEQAYGTEADLQQLIEAYPDLLAGDQMKGKSLRRWLLVKREMDVPDAENGSGRWSVDHLFLDQDGVPTLVEVKRSTDTRIRREVIGQMLDYAANGIVYWPAEQLRKRFIDTWKEKADQKLADFLGVKVDADNLDGLDTDTNLVFEKFWQDVSANLQARKMRLLFVADEIPKELQRVVEFLNESMINVEVLAIEIKQYVGKQSGGKQIQTLVPRVIGQTAKAEAQKCISAGASDSKQWNETLFFEDMDARRNVKATQVAHNLYEWVLLQGIDTWWGAGKRDGSCVSHFKYNNKNNQMFVLWSNGYIEFYFQHLASKPPFDAITKREELLAKLNAIPNVYISKDKIASRPSVPMTVFSDPASLSALIAVFEWVVQEIKTT